MRSGVVAGVAATVGFTLIHDLVISDIWAMLPIMAIAGAICGACLAWSYARLFAPPSVQSWLGYNTVYLVMFGVLGALSVAVFEPVTTMAAIIERGGPVDDLIEQALPFTLAFTLATDGHRRRRSDRGPGIGLRRGARRAGSSRAIGPAGGQRLPGGSGSRR